MPYWQHDVLEKGNNYITSQALKDEAERLFTDVRVTKSMPSYNAKGDSRAFSVAPPFAERLDRDASRWSANRNRYAG